MVDVKPQDANFAIQDSEEDPGAINVMIMPKDFNLIAEGEFPTLPIYFLEADAENFWVFYEVTAEMLTSDLTALGYTDVSSDYE